MQAKETAGTGGFVKQRKAPIKAAIIPIKCVIALPGSFDIKSIFYNLCYNHKKFDKKVL